MNNHQYCANDYLELLKIGQIYVAEWREDPRILLLGSKRKRDGAGKKVYVRLEEDTQCFATDKKGNRCSVVYTAGMTVEAFHNHFENNHDDEAGHLGENPERRAAKAAGAKRRAAKKVQPAAQVQDGGGGGGAADKPAGKAQLKRKRGGATGSGHASKKGKAGGDPTEPDVKAPAPNGLLNRDGKISDSDTD